MKEVWYGKVSYEDAKDLVKESLANTVGAFITAGYWLKYIRDQKEYEKEGYSSLWEMAEKEFGLKESEASRAMGMNDKYSMDGNSPLMLEKYCGYNKSQLQEMLTMTEEQLEQVTTDMKVHQMRQLKKTGATEEQLLVLKEMFGVWISEVYVDICNSISSEGNMEKQVEKLLEERIPVKIGNKVFFTGDDADEVVERTTGEPIAKYSKGVAVTMVLEEYRKMQEVRGTKKKPHLRGISYDPYCVVCGMPLNPPADGENVDIICPKCWQAVDWSGYMKKESVATSQEQVITGAEVIFEEAPGIDVEVLQETKEDLTDELLEAEVVEEIEDDEEETSEVPEFEVLDCEEETEGAEIIIDGEFREIPVEIMEQEEVSAYGLPKNVYPEGSSISVVGCGHKHNCFMCARECNIRQEKRYCREAGMGNPFPCTTMNVTELLKTEFADVCQFVNHELAEHTSGSNEATPCCKKCQVSGCGYRCGKSVYVKADVKEKTEPEETRMEAKESELVQIKKILEKEKELLEEYLEIDDLPVFTVKKQKIIVGALANMVCELEEMGQKTEAAVQPELPVLKNDNQRKEFIADYENWPVWLEQPLTGEKYYRYDFESGISFVVKVYFHKCFDVNARGKWEERYKDGWGAEEYYLLSEGKYFKDCLTNKSNLIEFLKKYQKE